MQLVQFSPSKIFSQHTENHGNEFRVVTKGEMIWAGGLKQKRNLLRNRAEGMQEGTKLRSQLSVF